MATKAMEVQTSALRVEQLNQHLQELDAQGGRLEAKRKATAAGIQSATASRAAAVESLLSARQDERAEIHRRIDSLESEAREESRNLEALDHAIEKLSDELAGVHRQLAAATEQAQREQFARETEAKQAQLLELEAATAQLGDDFVEALARLNFAAGAFAERGPLQSNFATELLEKFIVRHKSRGGHGWNYSVQGFFPNLVLEVRPMLPPGAKL